MKYTINIPKRLEKYIFDEEYDSRTGIFKQERIRELLDYGM